MLHQRQGKKHDDPKCGGAQFEQGVNPQGVLAGGNHAREEQTAEAHAAHIGAQQHGKGDG